MKKLRVAVCFYGQPRTAVYCAPWIKSAFTFPSDVKTKLAPVYPRDFTYHAELCDVTVDYFCDIKTESGTANSSDATVVRHSRKDIDELLAIYNPVTHVVTTDEADQKIRHTGTFYSPMYSSICRSVLLKQVYELKHCFTYDWVFVTRYDNLIGKTPNALPQYIQKHGVRPLSIYSCIGDAYRFMKEAFRSGPNDFMFWGDSFAIDQLTAYFYNSWATTDAEEILNMHLLGPNTVFNIALNDTGLDFRGTMIDICLVRQNADLTIPVLSSFEYHTKFWTQDHPMLKNANRV